MRIVAFQTADGFKKKMDEWIETFRSAKVAGATTGTYPGDPEREAEERIMKEGICVIPAIENDLEAIARELGIDFMKSGL
jgi:LDH2 family malate/lactate/ureidoglycolate dehydrogenase